MYIYFCCCCLLGTSLTTTLSLYIHIYIYSILFFDPSSSQRTNNNTNNNTNTNNNKYKLFVHTYGLVYLLGGIYLLFYDQNYTLFYILLKLKKKIRLCVYSNQYVCMYICMCLVYVHITDVSLFCFYFYQIHITCIYIYIYSHTTYVRLGWGAVILNVLYISVLLIQTANVVLVYDLYYLCIVVCIYIIFL